MKTEAEQLAEHMVAEMDALGMRTGNGTSMSPKRPTLGEVAGLIQHAMEKVRPAPVKYGLKLAAKL